VWDKVRGYNGHYNDVQHELLLVATRGSCVPDVATLPKSIMREEKTKHSRKPECFVQMEETLYPNCPRLELFQRVKRTGWDGWGNESV
jgi:N6-adenosine-specific RNA methylase IME4